MKTKEFLETLESHAGRPLVFLCGNRPVAAAGYHLTEVRRTTIESMDCGAVTHRWAENHFELWQPAGGREPGREEFMTAGQFRRIAARVEREVDLDGEAEAKVYAGDGDPGAVVYSVERVEPVDGRLVVRLGADGSRCKARERAQTAAAADCGGAPAAGSGCGGAGATPTREVACCG